MSSKHWFANPDARSWRVKAPHSALEFHRTLDGYEPTPLTPMPTLARELNVGQVLVKDETNRLGLPAFKILGASWATCRALCERFGLELAGTTLARLRSHIADEITERPVLVATTDGNHGRAVARVASLLGLEARIYIPLGLSDAAIEGIRGEGAQLIPLSATYDEVVEEAARSTESTATDILIQDTSWAGYEVIPRWIVDGYCTMFAEIDFALAHASLPGPHLVACPMGVGSFGHAMVDHYRSQDGDSPSLLGVEPETAACIAESLSAGEPVSVDTSFPTIMSGLNCGTPSTLGWPSLRAGLDAAVSVSEADCRAAVHDLLAMGQDAGPCGAATLAGVRNALASQARRDALGINTNAIVVLLVTESLSANPLR